MAGPAPGHWYPPPPHQGGRGGRVLVKILWSLVPPLTLGLVGFAPSFYLAVRHNRPRYWVFMGFFCLTTVLEWVVAATLPEDVDATTLPQDLAMAAVLMVNVVGAMTQFLVMDRPVAPRPAPVAGPAPYGFWPGQAPVPSLPQYPAVGHPAGPAHGQPHYPAASVPPPPSHHPSGLPPSGHPVPPARPSNQADQVRAELEEISEMLRRQE